MDFSCCQEKNLTVKTAGKLSYYAELCFPELLSSLADQDAAWGVSQDSP